MAETTTRRQTVNFLGFLRSQLSGLQGIPTLCYELIQNADDVKDIHGNPGATRITFDICEDALYVENDGVFREIDFTRMENVSWGNKREEAGTTGAFGIGFISVYQVTDSPEIYSNGRHWKFQPDASEDQRIIEEMVETQFTRFRLPWAFEVSNVRAELRIPPIDKQQLDDFAEQINQAIESACLFLKQVTVLEIKRSGKVIRHIETLKEADCLLVADGNQTIEWHILQGEFEEFAQRMRNQYGSLIEEKRQPIVKIAVPEELLDNGLLYAFLPSETRTGLPFHINADFYPSQDRKRIPFEQSYQSEWNHFAIQCAAETLANHVDELVKMFTPVIFWEFLERVKRASEASTLSPIFSKFWEDLKPQIRVKETVITTSDNHVTPPQAVYLDSDEQVEARLIFEDLEIDTVHPNLRGYRNLLIETGVRLLKITDVCDALVNVDLTKRTELFNGPSHLQSGKEWQIFWAALNSLWDRTSIVDKPRAENLLKNCAIAFGTDGAIWPLSQLLKAESGTQELFSKITRVIWFAEKPGGKPLPSSLIQQFGILEGINLLKKAQPSLNDLWLKEVFCPKEIYEWFEEFKNEVISHNDLKQAIRELEIWPTADKTLKPLTKLYLAGDFEDPLKLAQLVDVEALGGRREFLESVLNVEKLDFVTYVRHWVPSVLTSRELDRESRFSLLEVLAENLGKLQGHNDLQLALASLPLVWCGDQVFLPAYKVCFDSKVVREVLGPQAQIVQLPQENAEAIRAFYEWLGVSKEPRPGDIVARIRTLVSAPPRATSIQSIDKIFAHLANQWIHWTEDFRRQFSPLQMLAWLPGTDNSEEWFDSDDVFSIFSRYLFESQGNFLKFEVLVQQKGSELLKYLGVRSDPSPEQVVKHLLYSSEKGHGVTQEIYGFLNRNVVDSSIRLLRGKPCLYLKMPSGVDKYFRPDQVFWEQHPFAHYRYRLTPEFGRFKDLFDQLGVKTKPDAQDAISVLLEISEEFGASNLPLIDHMGVEEIVIRCWRILSNSLEIQEIDANTIKKALGKKKTIPDSRHILEPPIHLFFEDRPGWGAKFELVKNSLTSRVEGAWLGMEAAGVQRLSKVITTEMHECLNPRENIDMRKHLTLRRLLIQRIIEAHRVKGIIEFDLENFDALTIFETDQIEIVRVFSGFGRQESATLESVDAIIFDGDLYYHSNEGQEPWKGISRELSYVLHPSGELSSLGMELKEILSQSFKDASAALDEYGYPRIEMAPTDIPESPTLQPGDKTDGGDTGTSMDPSVDDGHGEKGEADGKRREPPQAPEGSDNPEGKKIEHPKSEKRKSSRLMSYVSPKDAKSTHSEDPEITAHRTEVGQLGVGLVMQYEKEQGRSPTDMETIQVHHPGYDIKSIDAQGRVRYIEVKSLSGTWDSQNPARVSKREYEAARESGDSFWLYVLEHVQSENLKMHRINNPAEKVDQYLFDHGWIQVSESE
jgi:hypothetical protein